MVLTDSKLESGLAGLSGFGESGKNRPFWTGLNRHVQNPTLRIGPYYGCVDNKDGRYVLTY